MGQLKTFRSSTGWQQHCHTYTEDGGQGHTRFPEDEPAHVALSPDEGCRRIKDVEAGRDDQA